MSHLFLSVACLLLIVLQPSQSPAAVQTLSPESYLKAAVTQSNEYQELTLKKKVALWKSDLVYDDYEPQLTGSWSYLDSQAEQSTPVYNSQLSNSYTLGLSKDFTSGTLLSLDWSRSQYRSDLISGGFTSSFTDTLSLSLEQDLWKNAFGSIDRSTTKASLSDAKVGELQSFEELESFVINAMTVYWDTFLAKETLSRNMASRQRLKELIAQVRKKRKVGYANREDLTRALAEYEDLERKIKQQSYFYISELAELNRWIKGETSGDIDFTISKRIVAPSKKDFTTPFENRKVLIANMNAEASRLRLNKVSSSASPEVKLKASVGSTDYDPSGATSISDASSLKSPFYSVGLSFSHPLFSKNNTAEVKTADFENQRNQLVKARVAREQENMRIDSYNLLQTNYLIYMSSEKSVALRKRAFREISRTFRQGRTDIDRIILAYNNLLTSEVTHIRALKDYHLARLKYLAVTDQLLMSELGLTTQALETR